MKKIPTLFENLAAHSRDFSRERLHESPMAYKPPQEIIDNIKDTVEIVDIIKPIYNFKASE